MTKSFKTTSLKQATSNPFLCLAAGGSGGHILPAMQLAKEWQQSNPTGVIAAFCSGKKLDRQLFAQHKEINQVIPLHIGRLSLRAPWRIPLIVGQLLFSLQKTWSLFTKQCPEKIISTGGIEAIPVCLIAKIKKIPIDLYELNVEPGKATKFLAPLATTIYTMFPSTGATYFKKYLGKCHQAAYPLRFTQEDKKLSREVIIAEINKHKRAPFQLFSLSKKTILIIGGSQGSQFLNTAIKTIISNGPALHKSLQILHQTGQEHNQELKEYYNKYNIPAEVFSYHTNIQEYYVLADVVICRAGAGTLFELLFFEKPAVIIPLISPTTHHQVTNAQELITMQPDLFTVVQQKSLETTVKELKQQVEKILTL